MISGINPNYADVNLLSNMIKDVTNAESDLAGRLLKVAVTEQVQSASQTGLGEVIDEYA